MRSPRQIATSIVKRLRRAGYEAYFAGGCVRDIVMGQRPHDYDITTSARPDEVRRLFARTYAVGAQFGVIIVVEDDRHFEVATFRTEGPYSDGRRPDRVTFCSACDDVKRRDFTINGLLYDPVERRVIDHVGGHRDIAASIVRTIGDPKRRFAEDKLRMLRAVRFAARFDFAVARGTFNAIRACAAEITKVSWERIGDELTKVFTGAQRGRGLQLLKDTGLLAHVLPEVDRMDGVPQPSKFHPEGDVFTHTRLMMDALRRPDEVLAFAALLHDVGKPLTYEVSDRIRFSNHETIGAEMASAICRRLRFSNERRIKIVHCVRNHMRFQHVRQMREAKLRRLVQADTFPIELEMHRADCVASHGDLSNYRFLRAKARALSAEEIEPKPLLTGRDLIGLGLTPGPIFKEILTTIEDLQFEGKLADREAALAWVKARYQARGSRAAPRAGAAKRTVKRA